MRNLRTTKVVYWVIRSEISGTNSSELYGINGHKQLLLTRPLYFIKHSRDCTSTIADKCIVDNSRRHNFRVIHRIEGGMQDSDIDQRRHCRTGAQSRYRVHRRWHSGKHDVDVLQYRRRLVDLGDAVDGLNVCGVVQLDAPPVITSCSRVTEAKTVQVNSSLEHCKHSNIN